MALVLARESNEMQGHFVRAIFLFFVIFVGFTVRFNLCVDLPYQAGAHSRQAALILKHTVNRRIYGFNQSFLKGASRSSAVYNERLTFLRRIWHSDYAMQTFFMTFTMDKQPLQPHKTLSTKELHSLLIWRSRRGMLELDLILDTFVRECFPTLSADLQSQYQDLLSCEDQDLYKALILGENTLPKHNDIISVIRNTTKTT